MKKVGNANRMQVEARYAIKEYPSGVRETVLDEVVAQYAHVHLEQMNDSQFALIVETHKQRACFMIGAKRAPVSAWEFWREIKKPRKNR